MLAIVTLVALVATATATATASVAAPTDWQGKIDSFNAFFAESDDGPLTNDGYPAGMYLPTIGNGYISHAKGVRGDTMFVSGVFNGETTSPSHRAAIPATLAIQIKNSETVGVLLDVESGVYHRRGRIGSATYELRWYAHRSLRSIYTMELEVSLNNTSSVSLDLLSNALKHTNDYVMEVPVGIDDATVSCGTTITPETTDGATHRVCVAATNIPSSITFTEDRTMTFLMAIRTSLDSDLDAVDKAALHDYQLAERQISEGTFYAAHLDAWSELWQSGIEVDGRPDVAVAVNASLFAILSSVRDDWAYGLAPGGLTNYYNGHSFWDTETWMYPVLLFLQPTIARALVDYRFARLEGAHTKAQSYSPPFSGAMFPWESAFSGVETCPTFAATGLREDHISGDISFAVWQQWNLFQDKQWLEDTGYPILKGVADFWVSRSVFDQQDGFYHIRDVIPPDEYVDHVNDSVYTNRVASSALQYAVVAASTLNVTCDECAHYKEIAEKLVILFDDTLMIHPEYKGYSGSKIKQADAVLLHFPLGLDMTDEVRRNDLEYYSARTDPHGPAMTWGMHSIGYLDLRDYAEAQKYFNMSFQDNIHTPLNVWTETPTGNAANFITGAGGFLQTMIAGYPGVRIDEDTQGLTIQPSCPEGVTRIKLRGIHYIKNTLDIEYKCAGGDVPEEVSITSRGPSELLLTSLHHDGAHINGHSKSRFNLVDSIAALMTNKNHALLTFKVVAV